MFTQTIESLLLQLNTVIVGKKQQVQDCVTCFVGRRTFIAGRHPGVGKTTLAHALAHSFGLQFSRVQFTADLMPSDLTGVSVYEAAEQGFRFHPGPVFARVLWPMKSTAPAPKPKAPCSKPWRKSK